MLTVPLRSAGDIVVHGRPGGVTVGVPDATRAPAHISVGQLVIADPEFQLVDVAVPTLPAVTSKLPTGSGISPPTSSTDIVSASVPFPPVVVNTTDFCPPAHSGSSHQY